MALWIWLFECARCRQYVLVCTRCLGGRRYCDACGEQAREESLREAGRNYQQTDAGRENHRLRQQRLRGKQRKGEAKPAETPREAACAVGGESLEGELGEGCPPGVTHQGARGSGEGCAKLVRASEAAAYVAVESGAAGGGHEALHSSQPPTLAPTRAERGESRSPIGNVEPALQALQSTPEARAAAAAVLAQLRHHSRAGQPVVAACSCCGREGVVVVYDGCPRIIHGCAHGRESG